MKSNIFNRPLAVLLLSLGSMVCGGCASIMTKPFPDVTSRFNLTVVEQTPLNHQGWPYDDCPPGTYHIEGKNVFVASLQGDENVAGAGAAFGLLGAAIATGDLAGSVKKKVAGSESLLCPDIQGMANECLKEEMEKNPEGARFIYSTAPGNNPILIIPYLVFSFVDDANANLWTVLKVEWRGKEPGGKNWFCRYIVGLNNPRPIQGEGGWTSGDGKQLQYAVAQDMKAGFQAILNDLNGKLRAGTAPGEAMTRCWMFYKGPHEAQVQVLAKNEKWMTVLPLVEDSEYFAGVNILPTDYAQPVPAANPGGK